MIIDRGLWRVLGTASFIAVVAAAVVLLALAAPVSASVADGGASSAVPTSEVTSSAGIVTNPSFEPGLSGWNASGSSSGVTLARVPGGHSGDWAAQLSNGGNAGSECVLNDAPNWVTTTAAGRYTASLWVRSDAPGATLKLKLREYDQKYGWLANYASSAITLTTSWQQVSLRYTAADPGTSTLDYTAYVENAPAGSCFYADDAAIGFEPAPSASLSVTPATGVPPVSVRADASGSAPTDLPIASYTFDFDDGSAPVGPQTEPTADHTYTAGGRHEVTVKVTDTDGRSSRAVGVVLLTANEIANSTFEVGTWGWNTSGSSSAVALTQVLGGHSGGWAARLSNGGRAAAGCVLNDAPNWVATSGAGRYTASLWVRSDAPGATLKLKLREYRKDNGAFVGSGSSAIALTTSWQQVKLGYAPLAPGASTLDYTASVDNAAAGTACFDADDAAIFFEPTPVASLRVTPATGVAPLSVQADASASAPPVLRYSFDFGDGSAVVGPQVSATADHSYASAGTYTVTVTVTYSNGQSALATRQVTVNPGIVANPSFESGTSGWNASGSGLGMALTQVADGHSGASAAQLANRGTVAAGCVLNDAPNWVATTAPGTRYTGSLWVRSDAPGARLKLKLREYRKDNGAFVGAANSAITLATSWRQVSVSYTPLAGGASTLDYTASVDNAAAGSVCFEADDAAIAPAPAASLTVTPGTAAAPLSVRADASASTGSDATAIASYRFDFGDHSDSAVVGPQAGATADHTYYAGGTYTVTVTVTDTAGWSSTATREVTTAQRVGNSSFESGAQGWDADGSSLGVTLTGVLHSHSGLWAADLVNGQTPGATCVLNDAPNWVATTAGGRYTASLWGRADDVTNANIPLTLKLHEYRKDDGALVGGASSAITLKTYWQQVSLDYVPLAPGASTLDYTASVANVAAGRTCFYADEASIVFEPPPATGQ